MVEQQVAEEDLQPQASLSETSVGDRVAVGGHSLRRYRADDARLDAQQRRGRLAEDDEEQRHQQTQEEPAAVPAQHPGVEIRNVVARHELLGELAPRRHRAAQRRLAGREGRLGVRHLG